MLVKAISNILALSRAINKITMVDKALLTTTLSTTTWKINGKISFL
jgi:hypothetical protein